MARKKTAKVLRRNLVIRQALIYGLLVSAFVVVGVASYGMFTGRIDPWFAQDFTGKPSPSVEVLPQPCPLSPASVFPEPSSIEVNVLNASGKAGAAKAGAGVLELLGFQALAANSSSGNYDGGIKVVSGIAGVDMAYALLKVLPESTILVMDVRNDASVDVVLGQMAEPFPPPAEVQYEPGTSIQPVAGCRPAAEIAAEQRLGSTTTPPTTTGPAEPGAA
ncbi:MAG: LytR C-terminal domain-containing protein [Micrococcales bacterium]|nr:LytR C-terminal domain-containing protein [Micrococcales bacterium]